MAALLHAPWDCESGGLGMNSDLNCPRFVLDYGGGSLKSVEVIEIEQ